LDTSDFDLLPVDGVGPNGRTGWPYTSIRLRGQTARFDPHPWPSVRVTGFPNWPAVPTPVKQATIILAQELFHRKDTKLGVVNFGEAVALIGNDPQFARMLGRYRRDSAGFGG
jgi:hypothetical protein